MPPNKLQHGNCKQFKLNSFSKDVENLSASISYTEWVKVFAKPLNRYAPQIYSNSMKSYAFYKSLFTKVKHSSAVLIS